MFAGLPGVPTRVRMVPTQDSSSSHSSCRGSEAQFGEPDARALSRDDRDGRFHYVDLYLRCALGERNWGLGVNDHLGDEPPSEAMDAVKIWALQASGNVTGEELRRAWAEDGHPNPIPVTLHTSRRRWSRPPRPWPRCRPTGSGPSWRRSGSGCGPARLPLAELPGQRP